MKHDKKLSTSKMYDFKEIDCCSARVGEGILLANCKSKVITITPQYLFFPVELIY